MQTDTDLCSFNAVQNNTSLKPQIQKSDRFFHFKARILFRITTP